MFNPKKLVGNLDELLNNPKLLGNAEPKEWYEYLKIKGCDPKPLSTGNFKDVPFGYGGGFIIRWSGDKILMYHPPKRTHHGDDAYWKLSSGLTGTKRYDLTGNIIEE